MNFDEQWEAYCDRTGNPVAENRGLAEEFFNAGAVVIKQEVYVSEHPLPLRCNGPCGLKQIISFKCPNGDGQLVVDKEAEGCK